MVNKHYNIQKYNKPFYIHGAGGVDGQQVDSSHERHSQNNNLANFLTDGIDSSVASEPNSSNLETICEERGDLYRGRRLNNNIDKMSANCVNDNHVNYDRVTNDQNMSINAIGRFQYILQMDKELVSLFFKGIII